MAYGKSRLWKIEDYENESLGKTLRRTRVETCHTRGTCKSGEKDASLVSHYSVRNSYSFVNGRSLERYTKHATKLEGD